MAATAPTTSPTATQRAQGADGATTATTTAADRFYHSLTTCRGELTGKDVVVKIVDAATGEVLVDQTRTTFCTSPDRRGAPRAGSSHGCVERWPRPGGDRSGMAMTRARTGAGVEFGLRQNAAAFTVLVLVNALVGGMVGQQQTVLPLLAEQEFGLTGYTFMFTYVVAFGVTKAAANYVAGTWSDRHGRKPVLVVGWLFAVPVPLMLIWAPSWGWVVAANVLLGINQGLTWSTTVVMKIDLVGPKQRGLAMGLNEAAGYGAVALTSMAAGYLAAQYGLRPAPFLLGLCYTALGLVLSTLVVKETRGHAQAEAAAHVQRPGGRHDHLHGELDSRTIFFQTSIREPALSSASQAGLVNNLNFGLSWGLFPLLFAGSGLRVGQVGVLFALYPAVWGVGQLFTGALSDRWGRRHLVITGMLTQAAALALIAVADGFGPWAAGTALLGAGTAMVYPTLLAVIGDVAHPAWRGRAVGVYRVWRDLGYAVGALMGGVVADLWSLRAAVWVAAGVSIVSALVVTVRMYETHQPHRLPAAGDEAGEG